MSPAGARQRHRRGEGTLLRQEILEAASRILETSGSEDGVTLRAIAREIGIAAPSIYNHFPCREAIVDQLVVDGFDELATMLEAAAAGVTDPVVRLHAMSRGYLRFAAERPRSYAVVFNHSSLGQGQRQGGSVPVARGLATFDLLVQAIAACAEAGRSASTDHFADAVAVWVGLHGLATLRASLPGFPWPQDEQVVEAIVGRLARLSGAD